jgi:hypothetical protein
LQSKQFPQCKITAGDSAVAKKIICKASNPHNAKSLQRVLQLHKNCMIAKGAVLKYCILSKLLTPNQASNTQPKYQTMLACSCRLSTRSMPQSDSILLTWEIACIYLSIYVCVIAEEFQ